MLHNKENSQTFNNPNCPEFDTCFDLKIALSENEQNDMENRIYKKAIAQLKDGSPEFVGTDEQIRMLEENKGIALSIDTGNWWWWNPTKSEPNKYVDSLQLYQAPITTDFVIEVDLIEGSPISEILEAVKNNYNNFKDFENIVIKKNAGNKIIYTNAIFYKETESNGLTIMRKFKLLIRRNETDNVYYYCNIGDNGVLETLESNTFVNIKEGEKTKYDNYRNEIDAINEHQDFQDKRLDNHNDRLNDIEDIIHETVVTEVEEAFNGNKFDVPTSVEVEGRNFGVIDNQYFKISGIKGQTEKSINKIPYPYNNIIYPVTNDGVKFISQADGGIKLEGTATENIYQTIVTTYGDGGVLLEKNTDYTPSLNTKEMRLIMGSNSGNFQTTFNTNENENWNAVIYIPNKTKTDRVIYPMLAKGKEKKDYVKYFNGVQDTTIKNITSVGSNKIPYPYDKMLPTPDGTDSGVTFSQNELGQIIIKGRSTSEIFHTIKGAVKLKKNTQYTPKLYLNKSMSGVYLIMAGYKTFTNTFDTLESDNWTAIIHIPNNTDVDLIAEPMLNVGTTNYKFIKYTTDKTLDVNFTLKGVNEINDEAILTKTNGTELYEVDVIRKVSSEDLGKLNWSKSGSTPQIAFTTDLNSLIKPALTNKEVSNIISANYFTSYADALFGGLVKKGIALSSGTVYVRDEAFKELSESQIKNSLKGVVLTYEKKAPTIEKPIDYQNLTLNQVSVLGQKGGEFQVNPIEPNIVAPKETRMKFDIKYWEQPVGGK